MPSDKKVDSPDKLTVAVTLGLDIEGNLTVSGFNDGAELKDETGKTAAIVVGKLTPFTLAAICAAGLAQAEAEISASYTLSKMNAHATKIREDMQAQALKNAISKNPKGRIIT